MKKLLAIALALMLLMASVACAETASVMTFSNPMITVTQGDQTNTADLTGSTLTVAMGMAGEEPVVTENGDVVDDRVPTIQFDIVKDGETLLNGVVQVIGERMVVDMEGLSRPIALDMSAAGGVAGDGYKTMFASLPELAKAKLPAFTGVEIPKVDLMAITAFLPMLGITPETTENSASFELPAEMVNMLLQMLISQAPEQALQLFGGADALNQMLASGGFALKGEIADDGETSVLDLGLYAAENGVTAEEAFLMITFTSELNSDVLNVEMSMQGQSVTLGNLALKSIPDQAELDAALNLMGGMVNLAFSLYPQDDAQVAALELTAQDQKLTASLVYGEEDGADYTDFTLAGENQFAMDLYVKTTGDGEGNEDGNCTMTLDTYTEPQQNIVIDGEISQRMVDDYTFNSIENAASAIDAATATEEENAQLQQELNEIGAKLQAAFDVIQPAA